MHIWLISLLMLSYLLFPQAPSAAKSSPEESKILALENAWNLAEAHKDTQALDQLLSETLVYTNWDGTFMTKKQFLDAAKKNSAQNVVLVNDDLRVQTYGDTAIVTGVFHERGTDKGKSYTRTGRYTHTWVKQSGFWLCVASHANLNAAK